jgi:two-component system sporulation sensor kinase A
MRYRWRNLMSAILLVEDDFEVQTVIEQMLGEAGYEIDATRSAEDACELLRCRAYDLVLADAKLPDGTGMAVADEARENGTPAMIMTGYVFTLPHGVKDRYQILLKPLRGTELLDAIEWTLEQSQRAHA